MAQLSVERVAVLRDNYVWLLRCAVTGACAAVDPAVAAPVLERLDRLGWQLSHVFNTHHHHDHTGGNLALKAATGCSIVGHGKDAARIPGIDMRVGEGDRLALGACGARVLDVSGHTQGHIAFVFETEQAVFCGDTLFSLGCGRLFEGTPALMWESLCKLRALPGDSRVYCGHEYTESNARFALTLDPDNPVLQERAREVRALRADGQATVPSRLDIEREANPFLRADRPELARAVGLAGADAVQVFAEIRKRKDVF